MTWPELRSSIKAFVTAHHIPEDPLSRRKRLLEEVLELQVAMDSGNKTEIIKECCDVLIVTFHILLICGVENPLYHCKMKLEEVSKRPKYRALRKEKV